MNPTLESKLEHWLDIARGLMNCPTAPLLEILPSAHVREFVARRPELSLTTDAAGNLRVDLRRGNLSRPPLVLVAHLDHPGFHVKGVADSIAELEFHGWHFGQHALPGSRVYFYETGNPQPTGEGAIVEREPADAAMKRASARVESGIARAGGFAMWAFPGFEIETLPDGARRISSRCCDDLLGASVILCVLDELIKIAPPEVSLTALFTRAEEIGFLGTMEAIRLKTLPQDSCVLSLETSKAFAHAPQGGGVIVRVGDSASIFDPDLTRALTSAAAKLAAADSAFKFQRRLMDGGACEATPFCAYGYRASGLALPLGNYHNQAVDASGNPCVGPENVRVSDFEHEIRLLVELALHPESLDKVAMGIPQRLLDLAKQAEELLTAR